MAECKNGVVIYQGARRVQRHPLTRAEESEAIRLVAQLLSNHFPWQACMTNRRYLAQRLLPNGYITTVGACDKAYLHAVAIPNYIHINVAPGLLLPLWLGSPSFPPNLSPNLTPSIIPLSLLLMWEMVVSPWVGSLWGEIKLYLNFMMSADDMWWVYLCDINGFTSYEAK